MSETAPTTFDPGIDLEATTDPLGFRFGPDMFGPAPELRRLDAIRASLMDPACPGPDPVYAIVMDVGRPRHREEMAQRRLLFGVVAYAAGRLGKEPVRSQGHVHKVASHSHWSAPEIFEIWRGKAVIYMQQRAEEDPGRCFAVEAGPGELVVVPPGWAHAVISADSAQPLVFGAWCDREYGFVYDAVRSRGGLAWFSLCTEAGELSWQPNPRYHCRALEQRRPRPYTELGLVDSRPLYEYFQYAPDTVQWVSKPAMKSDVWPAFEP